MQTYVPRYHTAGLYLLSYCSELAVGIIATLTFTYKAPWAPSTDDHCPHAKQLLLPHSKKVLVLNSHRQGPFV